MNKVDDILRTKTLHEIGEKAKLLLTSIVFNAVFHTKSRHKINMRDIKELKILIDKIERTISA